MDKKKIIIALDNKDINFSKNIVNDLKHHAFGFKIGYEFFLNFGLIGYKQIHNIGVKIFLDLKLHDIPNTVNKGLDAIANLNPYFTTIHLSGGDEMQKFANLAKKNTKILGVSVLTSLDSSQAQKYYNNANIEDIVGKYVKNAIDNKIDGVVCSPKEIKTVKKIASNKLIIVTPGIRPTNFININDDQKRSMTPKEAISAGANYLVIGRPITESQNPLEEIKTINTSIV